MADVSLKKVNVNKVAKAVLSIGKFALFQTPGMNLVVTKWFVLSVNEEQFWKIRCKLEAQQINIWLLKNKEGLEECEGANIQEVLELYNQLVFKDEPQPIDDTLLVYREIKLYTDRTHYYGIRASHLEMIGYPVILHRPDRLSVVVDDIHVFTLVSQDHTNCEYLRDLIYKGA